MIKKENLIFYFTVFTVILLFSWVAYGLYQDFQEGVSKGVKSIFLVALLYLIVSLKNRYRERK